MDVTMSPPAPRRSADAGALASSSCVRASDASEQKADDACLSCTQCQQAVSGQWELDAPPPGIWALCEPGLVAPVEKRVDVVVAFGGAASDVDTRWTFRNNIEHGASWFLVFHTSR